MDRIWGILFVWVINQDLLKIHTRWNAARSYILYSVMREGGNRRRRCRIECIRRTTSVMHNNRF